jgi:hypothetical protein
MKTLLWLLLPMLFSSNPVTKSKSEKKAYFYFCWSKPKPPTASSGKATLLYTDIRKLEEEDAFFTAKAYEWGELVRKICVNPNGCASDLNYNTSYAINKGNFDNILQYYSDTSKFIIKKIDFQ